MARWPLTHEESATPLLRQQEQTGLSWSLWTPAPAWGSSAPPTSHPSPLTWHPPSLSRCPPCGPLTPHRDDLFLDGCKNPCVHVHVYVCVYVYTYLCTWCARGHPCTTMCMHVHDCPSVCVCTCFRMCVPRYIYVSAHTRMCTPVCMACAAMCVRVYVSGLCFWADPSGHTPARQGFRPAPSLLKPPDHLPMPLCLLPWHPLPSYQPVVFL